uniref:Integrase catalytic domain-containing protein n=1 Tax=Salmo trutta TaxID=8032 RepID=A0A674DKS6_SALTR
MSLTKSADVVHQKSIFAYHGVPEVLVMDNGPQLSGRPLSEFAAEYEFCHVTSTPKFLQSNGEAKGPVQTVKNLLKKADDPYLALLAYRSTPLQNGFSPAQMLMRQQLHATVPTPPLLLDPSLPNTAAVKSKEKERRSVDQQRFNKRHRASDFSRLPPGKQVWMTDSKVTGIVLREHTAPQSYMVDVPHGSVRRNRHHLIPMDGPENNNAMQENIQVCSPL